MGNPFLSRDDGGPCWTCNYWRGWRTEPDGQVWTLCAEGMPVTFAYKKGNPGTGCRYWIEQEPVSEPESE